jgi:hypothetical protein
MTTLFKESNLLCRCILIFALIAGCSEKKTENKSDESPLTGTWKLVEAREIVKEDTTITFPVEGQIMIKIFNASHFSFFRHDLKNGQDSSKAIFVSGAGKYILHDNQYQEQLEYCNYREWENHNFDFTISFKGDTLVQKGLEKIDSLHVNREIIETYVRLQP